MMQVRRSLPSRAKHRHTDAHMTHFNLKIKDGDRGSLYQLMCYVMAAQQVKLALPVFFLLCTNLLLGTFTFYYAVKAKLPCNDTDMELENIPTTEVDLFDLGIVEDEFDEEIVLLGTAFGQVVSPTLKMNVTTSHVQELAMTTAALTANLSESAGGRE